MLVRRSTLETEPTHSDGSTPRAEVTRETRRRRKRSSRGEKVVGVKRVMEEVTGWWLVALLVLAPWAYGTTFPETRDWLAEGLCGLGVVFAVSLILRRRLPRINWWLAVLNFAILAQGWWMAWNAKLVYDPRVLYFHAISPHLRDLPGTVDQATSWHQMLLITGLFCAFWVVSDLGADKRWRQRLWLAVSVTGVSIVVLGLLQRASGAPGIFWRADLDCGPTFFATYRYHANAGAFINIILPLVAAQSICCFRRDSSQLAKAFWLLALLCVLASALVNVSRAATLITVGLVSILSLQQLHEVIRTQRHGFSKRQLLSVIAVVVIAISALVWVIGFSDAYKHWTELGNSIATNGRFIVYSTIWHHILLKSALWGFGPATFALIFPFFTNGLGTSIHGYWEEAHSDYLQTLVEWGFVGAVLWFLLFGSTIVQAGMALWRGKRTQNGRTRVFGIACFLALASVVVHAIVDFPMQIASLQLYTAVILGFLAAFKYADTDQRKMLGDSFMNGEKRRRKRLPSSSSKKDYCSP